MESMNLDAILDRFIDSGKSFFDLDLGRLSQIRDEQPRVIEEEGRKLYRDFIFERVFMVEYLKTGDTEAVRALIDNRWYSIERNNATGKYAVQDMPRHPGLKKSIEYLERVRSKIMTLTRSHPSNGNDYPESIK